MIYPWVVVAKIRSATGASTSTWMMIHGLFCKCHEPKLISKMDTDAPKKERFMLSSIL